MSFYQSEVINVHWPVDSSTLPVIAYKKDGTEIQIPQDLIKALFVNVPDPVDKFEGWDYKLQPGDTLPLTDNQVNEIQHAQSLDDVEKVMDDALTSHEQAKNPGTSEEPPAVGESGTPISGVGSNSQPTNFGANDTSGQMEPGQLGQNGSPQNQDQQSQNTQTTSPASAISEGSASTLPVTTVEGSTSSSSDTLGSSQGTAPTDG